MKNCFSLKYVALTTLSILSLSCKSEEQGNGKHAPSKPDVSTFVVDEQKKHQTIDNFGASDAWSMQYIGLWPKEKQEQMAEWLFSTETDEQGNPKGIGLSLWRFNIGAGSTEQGKASGIEDIWRRSECFLLPDGSYDWNKQKGQLHFMQLAKQRGVNQFLGFILSSPVYWTQNGLATNTGRGATFNLKEDKYDDFVRFLTDVIQGVEQKEGICFNYICPFNEPDGHWNWTGSGQEGTAATKYEVAKTVRLLGKELENQKIGTKILIPESFDYNCMYRTHQYTQSDRGYQIQSYFTPDSIGSYIGDVPNVSRLMAAHSYWTDTPLSDLRKIRMEMGEALKKQNVRYWQTEVCIMNNDEEIGGGGKKDLTMKTALYIARVIHHDLVYANASAWHWWRAVANTDYKDGLIYAEPNPNNLDGTFTDSKLMWTLGNYSRFIRPGAIRIDVSAFNSNGEQISEGDTDPYALMVSAYENSDGTPVVVAINYQNKQRNFNLVWNGDKVTAWKSYLTSDSPNTNMALQPMVNYAKRLTIPARSVITFVGER
ncbi:MAG TPA: glycoside hydrolase family 30 protein [Prolixibacteraceae bacterium]|nr:glycoside hydrolase family 30 protein [Prolixibacteraceae bacterium]HPS12593.1 glycoside hydrolase family 30 protein [Prolixibacteraceae bacterium]